MNAVNDLPATLRAPRADSPMASSLRQVGDGPDDLAGPPQERTLRRTGRKPVRFAGWQIVEAAGSDGRSAIWYDLNLFRTVAGAIVVELIARRQAAGAPDVGRVYTFESLDAAAAWLEAYRCADDVPAPAELSAADTALPWAVLQSVQLRQRLERCESDYRALLSDVFAALDLCDPAEAATGPISA